MHLIKSSTYIYSIEFKMKYDSHTNMSKIYFIFLLKVYVNFKLIFINYEKIFYK